MSRTVSELRRAAREARTAWSTKATVACALFAGAAVLPLLTGAFGSLDGLAGGLYLGVAAIGLGFAVGIGGIPSLAQGAFVGIGAFVTAVARIHLGLPLGIAALLGTLAALAAGLFVGAATVRLRPALIAVATLLMSWLALLLLEAFPSAFGGAEGLALTPALSARVHYELALGLLALSALGFAALARGSVGLRLTAAGEHAAAASAAGVSAVRLRTGAFGFAAALGGLAGGLSVDLAGVADPTAYGPALSFKLFVAVLIGGAASALAGPTGITLLGLVGVVARNTAFSDQLAARFQTMVAAVIVVLMLPAESDGLIPILERRLFAAPRRDGPTGGATLPERGEATPLRGERLVKRYGAVAALDGVDIEVEPGAAHALIGPNGSGKTTALRALAGTVTPDGGRVALGGEDVTALPVERRVELGIARTLQATGVFGGLTALENVLVGVGCRCRRSGFGRTLVATPAQRAEAAEARETALHALDTVGLSDHAHTRAEHLSSTDRRLLMIATALGTGPRVLLLDEPSAGVGTGELDRIASAIANLRDRGIGLLVVEHNLRLVRTIADRVTVLDAGRPIATGTPAEVELDPAVRAAYLGNPR